MGQQETCGVAYDEATLGNESFDKLRIVQGVPSNDPRKVEIKA